MSAALLCTLSVELTSVRQDDADGMSSMNDSDSAAPPAKKRGKAGTKASASRKPRASSSTLPPESDMSSLDDSDGGAPRKRAKGEKREKGKAKAKGAKHESELKRLQSYVNACGAFSSPPSHFWQTLMHAISVSGSRRQWKRLYAAEGIAEDDEKAQCALVRRVLDDLGMVRCRCGLSERRILTLTCFRQPARCSMKEAKRIREEVSPPSRTQHRIATDLASSCSASSRWRWRRFRTQRSWRRAMRAAHAPRLRRARR